LTGIAFQYADDDHCRRGNFGGSRVSGENAPVPSAQPRLFPAKYHVAKACYYFDPTIISTLLSYTKMVKIVATRSVFATKIHKKMLLPPELRPGFRWQCRLSPSDSSSAMETNTPPIPTLLDAFSVSISSVLVL